MHLEAHDELFGHSDFENLKIVSDLDLPAKAHLCRGSQGVWTGESGYFQICTVLQAWQAGIRISDLLTRLANRLLLLRTEAFNSQLICGAEHVCRHYGRRLRYSFLAG
jgi:hypothetical protein